MGVRDITAFERAAEDAPVKPGRVALACLLAWLLPGAGHWCLGRRMRAGVFFALVTFSFVLGIVLDGRLAVFDRRQPFLSSLQLVACLGSGPMEILGRTVVYGAPVYTLPQADAHDVAPRWEPSTRVGKALKSRHESSRSSYGTAYLWTAGLMNLLLLLDVFDIGLRRKV